MSSLNNNTRRNREENDDADEQQKFSEFQQECKLHLVQKLGYSEVTSGTTFGSHLHCYRDPSGEKNDNIEQATKHEHGEVLVLCVEHSSAEKLDSDLRYLSVASRIANSTRKRFFVAFNQENGENSCDEDAKKMEEKNKSKKIRMIELVSIT